MRGTRSEEWSGGIRPVTVGSHFDAIDDTVLLFGTSANDDHGDLRRVVNIDKVLLMLSSIPGIRQYCQGVKSIVKKPQIHNLTPKS